jgi:hypothetical protein
MGRWINTDHGYYKLTLPAAHPHYPGDPLEMAEAVWRMARHEWAHIAEYQNTGYWRRLPHSRRVNGRRPRWAARPEEQRAQGACADADAMEHNTEWAADAILELALWYENH